MHWVIIDFVNGLSPVWRQAITWTSADLLLIGLWKQILVKFNQNSIIFIQENAFENAIC